MKARAGPIDGAPHRIGYPFRSGIDF